MVTMTATQAGRAFRYADLETTPDDGRRHEIIDGVLIVTPSPVERHQTIAFRLAVLLDAARTPTTKVIMAPFDVVLADDTVMEPDLLVTRRADLTEKNLPTAPLLAVEVLSPSTRNIDLSVKFARFERAGCPSYWVIDPDGPVLHAWELREDRYVKVAEVSGDDEFNAGLPFPVSLRPVTLLDLPV